MQPNGLEPGAAQPLVDEQSTPLAEVTPMVERHLVVNFAAKRTRAEYREEAEAFDTWFEFTYARASTLADLTVANADLYLVSSMTAADERGRPWAKDTVAHHVRQLRAFAGHVAAVFGLAANPLATLSGPPVTKRRNRVGDALEHHETMAVFANLKPGRGRDLVAAGLFTAGSEVGPRTSELARAEVSDFSMAAPFGTLLGPVLTIRHPAKNGPVRTLPLGRVAEDVLRAVIGNRADGPLFPSRTGDFLSVDGIRDLVGRAGDRVGLSLSPQRLRRSAASWQATYGALSGHLDTVFGWAPDPADVKSGHYIKPTLSQLLLAHQERLSPLDRLEHKMGRLPFG
jgi:site-specific recombinase XerC